MKNVFPLDVNIGFEHGKSGCLSYINSNCGVVWSVALLQGRGGAVGSGRDLEEREELEVDCYTWQSRQCSSVCLSPTTLVHVTVSFTLSTVQSGMTLKLNVKQFLHSHVVTKSV